MTQPTIYIVMGGDAAVVPSAIAREEGKPGEILETVDWDNGKPDWDGAGICDHRGPGGEVGVFQLATALDLIEANAVAVGFEIQHVPKARGRPSEHMTNESLAETVLSGLQENDSEARFALDILLERCGND